MEIGRQMVAGRALGAGHQVGQCDRWELGAGWELGGRWIKAKIGQGGFWSKVDLGGKLEQGKNACINSCVDLASKVESCGKLSQG